MTETVYSPEFAAFLEALGAEETLEREFKEAGGGLPQSLWETVSAFANTSGGIIVLGIREQNDVLTLVGLPNARQRLDDLHSQARNPRKIRRDVFAAGDVTIETVDGKSVIVVRVRPVDRRSRPIFINDQAYGGTYVRRHTGDYVATTDEVNRMMREASDLSADLVIVPWATLDNLDHDAIAAYRRQVLLRDPGAPLGEFDGIEFLRAIEGYRRDLQSGEEGITVAGILMFGGEDVIREWRVRHLIDARLLPRGADVSEPDWADRIVWEGHLFGAYQRIERWLTQDLPVPFRLEQGRRVDDSNQHIALREALVNLLVHADYTERDASLILRWDGGVLFRNPGRSRIPMPGFHGENRSDPRNPALVRMFRRIGLAEEAGSGVPRIMRSWRELGYEPPEIEPGNDRHEFSITLRYEHLLSEEDRVWLASFGANFSDVEQLALVIARHEGGVDNQAVRAVTGSHGADVSKILTGLRDRGYLAMVGSKRGAWYHLLRNQLLLPQSQSQLPIEIPASTRNFEDSGLSLVDNASSLVGSAENLVTNEQNFVGSTPSLGGSEIVSTTMAILLQIAEPVRSRSRISGIQLTEIIVQLCATEPLSVNQLAELLNRSGYYVGETVRELVNRGELQPVHPERHHPKQRYVAQR